MEDASRSLRSATAAAPRLRKLLFPLAESLRKSRRFRQGSLRPSRHQFGRCFRHQAAARSQSGEHFCASHLHDWKRQPRRSRDGVSIRMPRLSHKAVLGEVADGAARESVGFLTLLKPSIAGSRWRATQRVFSFCRARHSVDTAFQGDGFGAEESNGPPPL